MNSWYVDDRIKKMKKDKGKLNQLKSDVADCAKKHGLSVELRTKNMKERDKKVGVIMTHWS